jgi:hypothetical protein
LAYIKFYSINLHKNNILRSKNIVGQISLLVLLFGLQFSKGQGLGNSPYSSLGIGERLPFGFAENQAMAGAGVASSMGIYVNTLNPALLARNRFTVFSMGMLGQIKGLKTATESQHSFSMNLNYLNLAFPVKKNWTMGIGLQPYSQMDFSLSSTKTAVPGDTTFYFSNYTAKGGTNKIAWNNAFQIGKAFYIGLETAVLFGQTERSTSSQLINDNQRYSVYFNDNQSVRGLVYRLGAAYHHKLKEDKYLNIGIALEPKNNVNSNVVRTTQTLAFDGTPLNNPDTLANGLTDIKLQLPSELRMGISLEHSLKTTLSADLILGKGAASNVVTAGATDAVNIFKLKNHYTVAVGAEMFPSFTSTKFLKRTAYRAGFSIGTSPYSHIKTGEQLNEFGISAGLGLPLRNSSLLNIGFTAGRRGTKANGGFVENYNRISIGFSLSDLWFVKQRID